MHILRQPSDYGLALARALSETIEKVAFCEICHNLAMEKHCRVCSNPARHADVVCVVEDVADLVAIERTHSYKGLYHVLHGALSPMDGVGPGDLKISELITRLKNSTQIHEIIIATNPNVNGDATALYLSRALKSFAHLRVTRLASGIPVGGHIEYIDQNTLSKALERRLEF